MNWWQSNPYGPPPPPWWGGQQQVPIPPGIDPLKVMEFMDRVQRRAQKAKEKEPKKDSKEKEHWKNFLWYFQAACILYFLSPPIAALQHIIAMITEQVMK